LELERNHIICDAVGCYGFAEYLVSSPVALICQSYIARFCLFKIFLFSLQPAAYNEFNWRIYVRKLWCSVAGELVTEMTSGQ